jgi:hypothetical protein
VASPHPIGESEQSESILINGTCPNVIDYDCAHDEEEQGEPQSSRHRPEEMRRHFEDLQANAQEMLKLARKMREQAAKMRQELRRGSS